MTASRKILRWALRVGLAVAILLLAALLGGYLALRSDAGRNWLVSQLEELASDPEGIRLSLDRLEGALPEELVLQGLELRDPKGVWLRADRLQLDWDPWALIEDELRMDRLTANRIEILRAPETPPAQEVQETPPDPTDVLQGLPLDLLLDRLDIAELVLGEELLGAAASLGVEGSIALAREGDARVRLSLERRDGTPGDLRLTAGYDRESRQMVLDLQAQEPTGGLLARALAVPGLPAFDAKIAGGGPLEDWRGSLTASFADFAEARGDFTLKAVEAGAEALEFDLTTKLSAKDTSLTGPWALLSPEVALSLRGGLEPEDKLRIDGLKVIRGADRLEGKGRIALDSLAFDGDATLALKDEALLQTILDAEDLADLRFSELDLVLKAAGRPEEAEIAAEGTLASLDFGDLAAEPFRFSLESRGPLDAPVAKIALQSEGLAFQDAELEALSLQVDYRPTPGSAVPAGGYSIAAEAAQLSHPALEPDLAKLAEDLTLRGNLRIAEGLTAIEVESLTLENDSLQLAGRGQLDPPSGKAIADLDLQLRDLAGLGPGLGLTGRAQGLVDFKAAAWNAPYNAKLSLRFGDLSFADPLLAKLVGADPQLDAVASLQPSGALALDDVRAHLALADVTGRVALDAAGEDLAAAFRITAPDISPLSEDIGSDLAGALKADIKLGGAASDPRVEGEALLREGRVDVLALSELRALFEARDLAGIPSGHVALEGTTDLGPVKATSDFRLEPDALALSGLSVMRKSDEITGKITLPLDGSAFFGDFSLSAIALADWLALAEMKGSGKLAGEVELSPRDSGQGASGKLHLSDLVLSDLGEEPLRLKGADIDFTLSDILADLRIASDIRVQDMELAELSLQETRATLKGSLEAIDFTLDTEGTFREPLTLSTDGRAELGAGEERLLLSKLAGQVLSQELRLVSPLALRRRGPDLTIAPTALRYGPAELSLSLESKGQEIDLKAEITKASLTQLAALGLDDLPEGELAAKLTLAGKRPEPRGHLELSLTDLKLLGEGEAPAARLEITGQLRQGRLVLKGDLTGLAESAAKLQADLPLVFDEVGLAPAIPGHEAISGSLTWRGDVAEIWPLVPLTGHALSGPGHLDLRLGGSLQNPDLQGNFRLAEGRYENFDLGTQFSDLIAEVALKGDRIELAKLEANDRRKGRLTADGALDLEAERNFPFAFQIGMRELAVLQRDDLLAITDGDLKITGDATKPELQGKLTTRRVEITIPEQLPAEVAVIEVSRAGEPEVPAEEETAAQGREDEITALLDVTVDMPRRVFVRGRGLESEWSGNLRVTGTSAEPRLKGKLELVRGLFTAVGKTFELEKGSLEFLGGEEINPLIDLRAVNRTSDLTAVIALSGPVQNPTIALSSEPPLPQDEVLSHLLFGKASGELSTLEAVQLASALAKLSGRGGGGLGILDRMRRGLGVDVLRVESSGEGEEATTAVKAGKYVTEDVYVGVTQGATAEAGGVEVEIEVTPNISIETENRSDGQSNVGVRFKWDY